MSSTRIVRTFALSALVGLFALSGCVFHSSSGSSSSRPSSSGYSSSGGKPIQHSNSRSSGSGKPISKGSNSSGSGKSISKGDNDDDDVDQTPVEDEPAKRTKPAERTKPTKPPVRTKPAERTPTAPVDDDEAPTTIRAKTVAPASNDRLVAPQHSSRSMKTAPAKRTTTLVSR